MQISNVKNNCCFVMNRIWKHFVLVSELEGHSPLFLFVLVSKLIFLIHPFTEVVTLQCALLSTIMQECYVQLSVYLDPK